SSTGGTSPGPRTSGYGRDVDRSRDVVTILKSQIADRKTAKLLDAEGTLHFDLHSLAIPLRLADQLRELDPGLPPTARVPPAPGATPDENNDARRSSARRWFLTRQSRTSYAAVPMVRPRQFDADEVEAALLD